MRPHALLTALLLGTSLLAQTPEAFNYQGVARDAGGDALANTAIGVQFQLHQGTAVGTVVYSETHSPTTNELGLFSLEVGNGTPGTGTFAAIDWSAGPYFLEVGMDPAGGSSYTSVGTQQLLGVPYALHAMTIDAGAESDPEVGTNTTGYLPRWSGGSLNSGSLFDNGNGVLSLGQSVPRLGIGTSSPKWQLHISRGSSNIGCDAECGTGILITGNFYRPRLYFEHLDAPSGQRVMLTEWRDGKLSFNSMTDNALGFGQSNILVVRHDGKVGIGTDSPGAKLHVAGSLRVTDGTQGTGKVLTSDASGNASWSNAASLPSGTQSGEMLYWDGSAWVVIPAGPPSLYGPDAPSLRYCNGAPTWGACTVPLGSVVSGGIVFHVDGTGEHGLIAKLSDDPDDFWGCDAFSTTTSAGVGEGANNRDNYELAVLQANQAAQSAYQVALQQKQLCCSSNGQTFQNGGCPACGYAVYNDPCPNGEGAIGLDGDWYVPSQGELDLMYTVLHQNGLGNFSGSSYWSSTETSQGAARTKNFLSGGSFVAPKTAVVKVRRVKSF